MMSSVIPSRKYSSSFAPLKFSKYKTATDLSGSRVGSATQHSASRTSSIEAKRCEGILARHRSTSCAHSGAMSGIKERRGVGVSRRIACSTSTEVSPRNGKRPVKHSYSSTPKEKMSERLSVVSPRSCSGAMYGTVPPVLAEPKCV